MMTNLIEEIKSRVNIEELARRLGREKQSNGFYYSIYKEERTPSLKIYPDTNSYYDFSSARGGDVIDFYAGYYNIETKLAVKELAELYGLSSNGRSARIRDYVPPKPVQSREENIFECMSDYERELYEERAAIANERVAIREVRFERLQKNIEIFEEMWYYCTERGWSKEALDYLLYKRHLTLEVIHNHKLFMIKNYWELNNHLKKYFDIEDLRRAGLFNLKEDGTGNLIFWNHRIMIPYMWGGQIVYLRGRYFDQQNNTVTSGSKYLGLKNDALNVNTPKRFYNRDEIKSLMAGEKLYIVEGEFDAMVLNQFYHTVAVPGVGNLPKESEFIALLDFDIIVCPDNDDAGEKLLKALIDKFSVYGKTLSVKRLPQNIKDLTELAGKI